MDRSKKPVRHSGGKRPSRHRFALPNKHTQINPVDCRLTLRIHPWKTIFLYNPVVLWVQVNQRLSKETILQASPLQQVKQR